MRELAANEVAHGGQMAVGAIAVGTGLGRLNAAIDGLSGAIVKMGVEVGEDACEVVARTPTSTRAHERVTGRNRRRSGQDSRSLQQGREIQRCDYGPARLRRN